MVIEVRFYDGLRRYASSSSSGIVAVDVEDDINVKSLLYEMEIDLQEVKTVTVNGNAATIFQILSDGDRVCLWPA